MRKLARVRPHAKIHISLESHEKTAEVYASNDLLATYCRILLLAVQRFAGRTGNTLTLHKRDWCKITGKGRADVALMSLRCLADVSPISVRHQGDVCSITIPNFQRKQGFDTKELHVNVQRTEDPDTYTDTEAIKSKSKSNNEEPWAKKHSGKEEEICVGETPRDTEAARGRVKDESDLDEPDDADFVIDVY